MKTVIVTGASGFIGSSVTAELLHMGYRVYGVGLGMDSCRDLLAHKTFIPVELPFEKYSSLSEYLIPGEEIEAFFHFAWQGGFERETLRDYDLQLYNAKCACDAANVAAAVHAGRFIYAASINEIESQQFLNDFSSFRTRPTCIYAAAKLTCELMCRTITQEKHMGYNAGIIPMIYGVGNRSKQLVNTVMTALISGRAPKLISGHNLYDLVSVKDVARAFAAILESGKDGERYYIGHRQLRTFREWMEHIGQIINPEVKLKFGEYQDSLDLDYSMVDLDALFRDTGYECRENFEEGIRETAKWLKQEGEREPMRMSKNGSGGGYSKK